MSDHARANPGEKRRPVGKTESEVDTRPVRKALSSLKATTRIQLLREHEWLVDGACIFVLILLVGLAHMEGANCIKGGCMQTWNTHSLFVTQSLLLVFGEFGPVSSFIARKMVHTGTKTYPKTLYQFFGYF